MHLLASTFWYRVGMATDPLDALRRAEDPLVALADARRLEAALPAVVRELAKRARESATWAQVAEAGGWDSASAARYAVIEATPEALAGARARQAKRRGGGATGDLPGVSTMEAADRLGVTRSRVNQMVKAEQLKTISVSTPGGRTLYRIVDERVLDQSAAASAAEIEALVAEH